MKSHWEPLKATAILMRKKGASIGKIEMDLGIPRSTLSGWFKRISLSKAKQETLLKRSQEGLIKARALASKWHNEQKEKRVRALELSAQEMLAVIDMKDIKLLEITLAILYFGEGSKRNLHTAMGGSDSLMIRFFVYCLQKIYSVPIEKIRCNLHLRYDQDETELKKYWSRELQLPLENFGKTSFDPRTKGKPTYPEYRGVCLVNCGRVEIQRRLMYIAKSFCLQAARKT